MEYRLWNWDNQGIELQPNVSSQHLLANERVHQRRGSRGQHHDRNSSMGSEESFRPIPPADQDNTPEPDRNRANEGQPEGSTDRIDVELQRPSSLRGASSQGKHGSWRRNESRGSFLLLLLSIAVVTCTTLYACHTTLTAKLFITSSSESLLILRVLSETCTILLYVLVLCIIEDLQWAYASRAKGIGMLGFLSLDAGTRVWGLLRLLCTRSRESGPYKRYSFIRLCLLVVVPIPGITIMSSLKIEPSFSAQASYPVAAGLADLNASTALSMSPTWATALLFDIGSPLWDIRNSIEMKPLEARFGRCRSTSDETRYIPCEESYLLTGGCLRITPQKDDLGKHPDATIYVVADTKSYQVEFDDVHDQSKLRSQGHCKTHGYPIGAVHTCIALGKSQEIQHGYGVCPQPLMASGRCLTNTSWIEDPFPYASSLYVYRRTATVYYSRSNFSIVAVKDLSDPDPFLVKAEDLSVISDVVMRSLNFRNANSSDTTSSDLAVFMSAGLQKLDNPFVLRLARTEGRKALATMLQYFHANHVGAGGPESVWEASEPRPGLPPDMYTTLQIAVPSYHVVASSLTLYIFIGISSALLLLCFTTIIFTCGTVTRWPWRTGYPALDFAIYCLPTRMRHHRNLYKTLAEMREQQSASIGKNFETSRFHAN